MNASLSPSTIAIGIDFGTTKTMVSYLNPATGRPELVRLGRDRDSIPTTVHVDESGTFLFGEDADDQIETDPEGYCRAFKLHLGEQDPVLLRSDETAESLVARFLRRVKEECEQTVFHGESITSATITIPVIFSPARKAALQRAAEAAGFSSVSFIPEPEAAGTAFLRDNPADKFSRALVLDWGGGTLDIAIISRDERGTIHADRHCAEGRDDVGGEEMDRGLLENLNAVWIKTFGSELLSADESEPKLLREAEKVKIGLSRKAFVPFRRGPKRIDIPREQFNVMVEQLLAAAVELVRSALSKNKANGNPEPDAILLIGGTCQSPVVREPMEKAFPNLRVLSWHHSHEAVALGATAVPKPETEKSAPIQEEREVSLTSETSFQVDLRGSASKKNADAPFKLTDEVLALAEKVAVCDRPVCAEERRFIERALQENGVTDPDLVWNTWGTKPEWQLPSAGELAAAAAASLGSKKDNLLKCHRWLVSLAACDGPMTPEETSVIETIAIAFMFSKDTNKGSRPNAKNPEDSTRLEKVPTLANHGMIVGGIIGSFFGPGIGTVAGAAIGRWIGGKMYNY